jgi:hypothetical protein
MKAIGYIFMIFCFCAALPVLAQEIQLSLQITGVEPAQPITESEVRVRVRLTNAGQQEIPAGSRFTLSGQFLNSNGTAEGGSISSSFNAALGVGQSYDTDFRHTFQNPGDYTLRISRLEITDNIGRSLLPRALENLLTHNFHVNAAPVDLAVGSITIRPSSPTVGNDVTIEVPVNNQSVPSAGFTIPRIPFKVRIELLRNNQKISNWPDQEIRSFIRGISNSVRVTQPRIEAGDYTVNVIIDPDNVLDDIERVNNTGQMQFRVAEQLADLVVKNISIENNTVKYGIGAWVTFTVKNEGQGPIAGSIFLQKEVVKDGVAQPKSGYFEIKGGLAPGEEKSHRFKVGHDRVWPVGNYTLRVIADYRSQINESSENNNTSADIQFRVVQ